MRGTKTKLIAWLLAILLAVPMLTGSTVTAKEAPKGKEVITYFANWYLDAKPASKAEVAGIPWDKVTYINHAFWAVAPADGSTETSFERRDNKLAARTKFKVISTDPKSDYEDQTPSAINPSIPRNHFAEYAEYSKKYPSVNIMISVGGWTKCGYFSEMAYTAEGRKSFVNNCIALMDQYPWIDGIDIDWEYPGGNGSGERYGGDGDEGCPIFGTADQDKANFAALLKDMREGFDTRYGAGVKKLTSCASSSTGWTLPYQDWAAAAPYLDMINIMTYDMAGSWDGVTGHASNMPDVQGAVEYFKALGISVSKLNIGTPFYATGFKMKKISKSKIVGAPIEDTYINGDDFTQPILNSYESQAVSGFTTKQSGVKVVMGSAYDKGGTGWHYAYDSKMGGTYLYNDDPKSKYYKYYLSYESPLSLQAKINYIQSEGLCGIIIWEFSQDDTDNPMITQLASNLLLPPAVVKIYDANGTPVKNAFAGMTFADGTVRKVFAKEDGTMAVSEIIRYQGDSYYCEDSGSVAVNKIITFNGGSYYASETGKLAVNKVITLGPDKYYTDLNGEIVKGEWVSVGNKKYYCSNPTGQITSEKEIK
ncbi:glycoside hydrolase family 18 protein [Anaerocolumna xylanovorans]|uniref:chitinase n=1 Tax=Anaerocolumna xylanovorans DSM 12503 TaxID=1121345 RepID=A0A1M7Y768_9FIRM|nr:glycosyl hydrolase family 18 protein [Anaerocolumna xylanovorans]SHO48366.1 chitinase [Anaerocolumna xylanovorans DSM 12503]